ncbi:nucleotidyltransferase domain-containing protein [Chryseobacterium sp.]|uniref:nucleotidyltransferase family protein n=1 Tax=Chryseobacterium sp. TaxID=1871047 RepID=UPI0028A11E11|nr:nucleotidyltransferase domain-containing protein [Chryseobacterium sp.]
MRNLDLNKKQIEALCKSHKVENLYLFGSILNDNFNSLSDIDILVKFYPINFSKYFENYLSLKESLSRILGRKVDLVEEQTLKNPILINSINRTKQKIYG